MKKIKHELKCVLNQEELASLGISACEDRDKARQLKEEASTLEKAAKEKERQVAEKVAVRVVECVEVKNFEHNEVRVERTDDRKYWPNDSPIVETRAMTGEERQTMIDVGDGKSGEPAKKVTTKAPAKRGAKSK